MHPQELSIELPDAGRCSATACRLPTARRVSPPRPGQGQHGMCDAARVASAGTSPSSAPAKAGRGRRASAVQCLGGIPVPRRRVAVGGVPALAPRLCLGGAGARRRGHNRRGARGTAAGWREATGAEAVSGPTRHRDGRVGPGGGVPRRGDVVRWAGVGRGGRSV